MYSSYFGFREKPFSVTPDPRFFYTNLVYQEAYASLFYGVRDRKGFIVLTGQVGTGKTTLLRRLMDNLDATVRFVFFYNTTLTFEELITFTCEELGLSVKGEGRLQKIQALNDFLIAQLRKGGTGVLLIDEAQHLGEEVLENLRLLSNLETASQKLLQIVLVGQPELEAKLDHRRMRQVKQRIAVRCRLDCLKDREVPAFIDYRLRMVGYERQELFTPRAIQRIARYSGGIPRVINIICDNALLLAYGASRRIVSAEMIEEVARDLRLGEGVPVGSFEAPMTRTSSKNGKDGAARLMRSRGPRRKPRRLARVGIWTFLILLFVGAGVSVTSFAPAKELLLGLTLKGKALLGIVGEGIGLFEDNVTTREAATETIEAPLSPEPSPEAEALSGGQAPSNPIGGPLAAAEEALPARPSDENGETPERASSPAAPRPAERPRPGQVKEVAEDKGRVLQALVIPYGATISEIVFKSYGNYSTLALDLISEFNPHLEDLDLVKAGERVWLPPLTRETLTRSQPDGSYRLILASFPSTLEERFGQLVRVVRLQGYRVEVTPRRITTAWPSAATDNQSLYRVEIVGLKSPEAVDQAWRTALARYWVSLP